MTAALSPFGRFYPEWQATASEIRSKSKRRSVVSMGKPLEANEPTGNVLQFQTGEWASELQALLESNEIRELSLSPVQLIALILGMTLRDRSQTKKSKVMRAL